jgi:hypothetical protein
MKTNIIVSDITCMKEKFCLAGWDLNECRMKRMLINHGYWDDADLARTQGHSWIIVDNEPLAEPRDYPHRTEDVNIDIDSIEIKQRLTSGKEIVDNLRASISPTIRDIFNNKVKFNSYVPSRTRCASLGAINVPVSQINFTKENGKLRTNVVDNDGQKYCLKVSCKYIHDIFAKTEGVDELNAALQGPHCAHLRIGLARSFLIQENHCYIMLNGLFLF